MEEAKRMDMHEIMGISRHRMGIDGKGVRTLIAFYGCPLDCKYCINRHCKDEKTPRVQITPEELLETVQIDNIYFRMTGGGITFGGGEPLMASSYIADFCRIADKKWAYAIETSLYGSWTQVETLIPYIDQWIVDIKDTNPVIYRSYTGKDNAGVLDNLEKLKALIGEDRIFVRIPKIPDFNTEDGVRKSWHLLGDYKRQVFDYIRC